jgi:hypothetical protein
MQRAIEVLLVIAILIGAAFLMWSVPARGELQERYDQLVVKTGRLEITDPTRVHIRAIPTGDPLHFAWRAYFPPNYPFAYSCSNGGGSSSRSESWEGILRVRMRNVDGNLQLYYRFMGGSGLRSFGTGGLRQFLKEHPDLIQKLQIEQLAAKEPLNFAPDEAMTLVKISLSEEAQADARRELKDWEYRSLTPDLEWIRIGPREVLEQEKKAAGK